MQVMFVFLIKHYLAVKILTSGTSSSWLPSHVWVGVWAGNGKNHAPAVRRTVDPPPTISSLRSAPHATHYDSATKRDHGGQWSGSCHAIRAADISCSPDARAALTVANMFVSSRTSLSSCGFARLTPVI
jgi:hypothetical protein